MEQKKLIKICPKPEQILRHISSLFAFYFGDFKCVAPEQILFGSSVYQFQKVSIHVNEQKFKETQNNNLWTVKSWLKWYLIGCPSIEWISFKSHNKMQLDASVNHQQDMLWFDQMKLQESEILN